MQKNILKKKYFHALKKNLDNYANYKHNVQNVVCSLAPCEVQKKKRKTETVATQKEKKSREKRKREIKKPFKHNL